MVERTVYVKEGDVEVAPMENPEDYQYDIDVPEVDLSCGVVVALLVVGYLTLPLMYYAAIENLASSMGEYQTLVKGVGLFTLLWILAYPLLSSVLLSMNVLTRAVLVLCIQDFEWYALHVWRSQCPIVHWICRKCKGCEHCNKGWEK